MFKTRLLSGIVLVIAALVLIITGGDVLLVSTLLISWIGMFELYRIFHIEKSAPGIVGYATAAVYYANLRFGFLPDLMMLVLGLLIVLMFVYVFTYPKYQTEQLLAAFFGVFYVAVMLSYVYQTRMLSAGTYIVWLIFLCSWGCDTCAYCVGMLIGKHKMTPKLSPKKTVEGAIGGVLGTMVFGVVATLIYSIAANRMEAFTRSNIGVSMYVIIALLGCIAAVLGIYGDLFASVVKRQCGIKDYGTIFPGHGGILDRFDSVMFIAPFVTMVVIAAFYD